MVGSLRETQQGGDVQVLGVVFVQALRLDLNRGKIEAEPIAQQVVRLRQKRCGTIRLVGSYMGREDVLVRGERPGVHVVDAGDTWQLVECIRHRETKAISLLMYVAFAGGVALWLVFGVLIGNWAIIVSNAITLVLTLAIVGMKIRYG